MKTANKTNQIALTGLLTAVICIISPFSIMLPFSPIPLSLGTFAIYFCVIILGMKQGTLSVLLYLLLGLTGLPIFTNFTGGVGKLLGPTGGYLIGYIPMALICGFFTERFFHHRWIAISGMLLGTASCYLFGTLWLSYQSSIAISQAFLSTVLPCLPGDIIKLVLATALGSQVRRRLSLLLNL